MGTVSYPGQLRNPRPWIEAAEHGIAPIRVDLTLLYGPRVNANLALFTEVLGFYLTEYVTLADGETKGALWLSWSIKAHDIALVEHPEPGKLHHISFLLESWEKILRAGGIMSMNQVKVEIGPTRHGITRGMTIYGYDPTGNRFETFCGGLQSYPRPGTDRLELGGIALRPRLPTAQTARDLSDSRHLTTVTIALAACRTGV